MENKKNIELDTASLSWAVQSMSKMLLSCVIFRYHKRDRDAKNAEKRVLDFQAQLTDAQAKLEDADNMRKHAEAEAAVSMSWDF